MDIAVERVCEAHADVGALVRCDGQTGLAMDVLRMLAGLPHTFPQARASSCPSLTFFDR